MFNTTYFRGAALAVTCALTFVACEAGTPSPTSPSAVVGLGGNVYSDGSNLKVYPPNPAFPLNEATDINLIPTLIAQQAKGRFYTTSTPHRFQVSTSADFTANLQQGMGEVDGQGVVRFAVNGSLSTATKYYWRARAELEDASGSWSNVFSFTTTGTPAAPTTPTTPTGNRTPDPAPGTRLPLPNMQSVLAQFNNASDSCPEGIKYIPNPWQNRVIDRFRQDDTRWGYNGKPNRTAADNGGRPVVAAGDEAAYNYGSGADQGTTNVHLVDLLVGHCGPTPTVGWRVFTGEEPAFWTGAGRF